jgi:predicted outer membrane lipoprotein
MNVALWILQSLLAAAFLMAGAIEGYEAQGRTRRANGLGE